MHIIHASHEYNTQTTCMYYKYTYMYTCVYATSVLMATYPIKQLPSISILQEQVGEVVPHPLTIEPDDVLMS